MATHANPKKQGRLGNICAFCLYFEGEPQIRKRSGGGVEYNDMRGSCAAVTYAKYPDAHTGACDKFQLSQKGLRYAR